MMKIMTLAISIAGVYALTKSNNPLKASMILLVLSAMGFLLLKMTSGLTWFPLLMFLLFTGGILMTFMILSSILPNSKAEKMKTPKIWMMLLSYSILMSAMMESMMASENVGEAKSMISSIPLFSTLTLLMLAYFFYSIEMHKSEDVPMRSIQCCMTPQFCKL